MPTRLALIAILACFGCHTFHTEIGVVEDGTGLVRLEGSDVWKEAEINSVLLEGDALKTPPGWSIALRLDGSVLVLNENTSLRLGRITDEGFRRIEYEAGDLFVLVETPVETGFLLVTGAGNLLLENGAAILRMDPLAAADPETPDAGGREVRLQAVLVRGDAVAENLGMSRPLRRGDQILLLTGAPPTEPTRLPEEVVQDYEWVLDSTLGRASGPVGVRPPMMGSAGGDGGAFAGSGGFEEGEGEEMGEGEDGDFEGEEAIPFILPGDGGEGGDGGDGGFEGDGGGE